MGVRTGTSRRLILDLAVAIIASALLLLVLTGVRTYRQERLDRSLVSAVEANDVGRVRRLLEAGASADAADDRAVPRSLLQILRDIVLRRRFVHRSGPTCLLLTLQEYVFQDGRWFTADGSHDNSRVARLLVAHGASLGRQGPFREEPLLVALTNLEFGNAHLLAEHGSPLNDFDEVGYDPLLLAAFHGDYPMARELLERGADPNVYVKLDHWSPLMYAIVDHNTQLVEALLEHGADVNAGPYRPAKTPLAYAEWLGWCPDIVKLLKAHGGKR